MQQKLCEYILARNSLNQKLQIISLDDSLDGSAGCIVIHVDAVETEKGKGSAIDVDDEVEVTCCNFTPRTPRKSTLMHRCASNVNLIDTSKTPAEVFLKDDNFASFELDHNDPNCVLSEVAMEQLAAVRRDVQIDLDPLLSYVDNVMLAQPDANCTQAAYID